MYNVEDDVGLESATSGLVAVVAPPDERDCFCIGMSFDNDPFCGVAAVDERVIGFFASGINFESGLPSPTPPAINDDDGDENVLVFFASGINFDCGLLPPPPPDGDDENVVVFFASGLLSIGVAVVLSGVG